LINYNLSISVSAVINNWPVRSVLTCYAGLVNPIDTVTAGIWLNQVPDLSRLSGLTHGEHNFLDFSFDIQCSGVLFEGWNAGLAIRI
jgi:hypothetical protein